MRKLLSIASPIVFFAIAAAAHAAPSHCLVLYGTCKYSAGFTQFEYVNVNAPKRGEFKLSEVGTFDSLNPFILKGVKAPGITLLYETLMTPAWDEPQSYYGLVAESIDVAPDKSKVSFVLREEAKWHDGVPITAEDVVFSFNALKEKGDPTYRMLYTPIDRVEKTGAHSVTFYFKDTTNRELPILAATMPILPKHYYDTVDFEKSTLEPPLGSGPYKVKSVDPGRSIYFERVKNYWGEHLPVSRGTNNFDVIRYDMYRDENVSLEAFKAGEYDFRREYVARNWATAYDSPALKEKRYLMRELWHKLPQGMQAFVFNVRNPKFADRRVREAIGLALDYEWLNKTIFYNAYQRNNSFFSNTPFAARELPDANELKLLEPFRSELPEAVFTTIYNPPKTDGSGNARDNLLKAQALLNEAGYIVKDGKRVNAQTGEPLTLEFMLRQPTMERVAGPMRKNLERLGISSSIRRVDDAQYQKRTDNFDYEMVSIWVNRDVFFPGNEQMLLWHSSQADVKGSNNITGLKSPAVDAILSALINAKDLGTLTNTGRALDRVLLHENLVIPHWQSSNFRVAYWDKFGMPPEQPQYNMGIMGWWLK